MAISDIVDRIAADAEGEAAALIAAAQADAERVVTEAKRQAASRAAATLASARSAADRDAETALANARLSQRDTALAERRALIDDALASLEERITALPDDRYARLLARGLVGSTTEGTTLLPGRADAERLLTSLPHALGEAGVSLQIQRGDAGIERGVVLVGDRVRVEISPASLIDARRDELVRSLDRYLFGPEREEG